MVKMTKRRKCDTADEEFRSSVHLMKVMIFVSQLHRRAIDRLVGEIGLHRGQHRMLMTLADHEFGSQSELADRLEISSATVAVSLKKLETGGYIQKTAKADDSRANFVQLTEKGKKVVEDSREIFGSLDKQAVKGFTEEEMVLLRKCLWHMYDNLSEWIQ